MHSKNTIFTDLKDEWPERLKSINNSTTFIYIATYYIDYDEYGIAFCEALIKAAMRDVRVYILVDSFALKLAAKMATKLQNKNLKKLLKDLANYNNINLYIYKPTSYLRKIFGGGAHIKFQINNKSEVFISSGNITSQSYEKWRDISLYTHGKTAAEILYQCKEYFPENALLQDIEHLKTNETRDKTSYDLFHHNPNNYCRLNNIFQNNYKNIITDRICELINNTKEILVLSCFYFKPNILILNALIEAAKRGVNIGIIHSHISSLKCSEYPWFPCLKPLKLLLEYNNVNIYEDIAGQHAKYLVSDNQKLFIGSYNFEHAAHDMLSEIMLETTSTELITVINDLYFKEINKENVIKLDIDYIDKIAKRIKLRYLLIWPILRMI